MSERMVPESVLRTVCDLCGKPIKVENSNERGEITFGWIAHKANDSRNRWWTFRWDPRSWAGFRRPSLSELDNDPRYKRRQWDFHSECLIGVLEPIIEAGEVE